MDVDSSDTNLLLITKRHRMKIFLKIYRKVLIVLITPTVLLPIVIVKANNAYTNFYIFLVTVTYWLTDVMHPCVTALVPIALNSITGTINRGHITQLYVRNELLDCFGIMMIVVAIEQSRVHRRLALKLLLTIGYSHYKLSFFLFFSTMCLSMWFSNIVACGLMMPLVKAILDELEKMGILDMYQTIEKSKQAISRRPSNSRPTDVTVFYFLGVAYSSSIGAMATIIGSQSNQILKRYCETIFPLAPKIEFPHFMLLNLPGVLLMETLLYLWMNAFFLGMFRSQTVIALEIGLTDDETQYITTLLTTQYQQLGKINCHQYIVSIILILTAILQLITSSAHFGDPNDSKIHSQIQTSAPCILSALLLFLLPVNLNFMKFFRKRNENNVEPLPNSPSNACLNWSLVKDNIHWSVLIITGGSCFAFEALKDSGMTDEMGKLLLTFKTWPQPALLLAVIVFCKMLTEFASNSCVAYCLLPSIARLGVASNINPHYLMVAGTLSCGLPFHLMTGSPVNAMVAAYVNISPWKMMRGGIGLSVLGVVVTWCTVVLWSKAIWADINSDPEWADVNTLNNI